MNQDQPARYFPLAGMMTRVQLIKAALTSDCDTDDTVTLQFPNGMDVTPFLVNAYAEDKSATQLTIVSIDKGDMNSDPIVCGTVIVSNPGAKILAGASIVIYAAQL